MAMLTACATTKLPSGGHEKMLGYTDEKLFVIEHHDPAHGGRIVGTVCAVDVQLDVRQQRDGVVVRGLLDDRHSNAEGMFYDNKLRSWTPSTGNEQPYYVETHDSQEQAERKIVGSVGDSEAQPDPRITPPHTVELTLTRDLISGKVGARRFELHARGDDYVGNVTINQARMPYVLRGSGQLWAMPAAAQASILPLLLTCTEMTKVIQLVDLRQSQTPPPAPPRWIVVPPQAPAQVATPRPMAPPPMTPSPSPSRAPSPQRLARNSF
jgi:hypothetical protein